MIKELKDIKKEEINLFGGKATNLGFLIKNGFNVPEGFCISTDIQKLTNATKNMILKKYLKLKSPVAVRSSGTVEDAKNASFAGQFNTFLNVKSEDRLLNSIKKCWNSVNSKQIIEYAKNKKIKNIKMAVLVQKMIDADFAGVILTIDPIHKKYVLIETVKGLGDKLVSGKTNPNTYYINKKNFNVENKTELFKFSKIYIKKLLKIALEIESAYNFPQDIEFAIKDDEIYVLQSRPITTL